MKSPSSRFRAGGAGHAESTPSAPDGSRSPVTEGLQTEKFEEVVTLSGPILSITKSARTGTRGSAAINGQGGGGGALAGYFMEPRALNPPGRLDRLPSARVSGCHPFDELQGFRSGVAALFVASLVAVCVGIHLLRAASLRQRRKCQRQKQW